MSQVMIALLLLVPIIIVVIILNTVHKSSKKRTQTKIHQYILDVMRETSVVSHHHEQLINQTVIIDQKTRRLLVIDHKQEPFSYNLYHLDLIKNVQVSQQQLTVQKAERITTHIGIELKPADTFICLYDYHQHNVFQMADFEKAANALKETIDKARNKTLLVT